MDYCPKCGQELSKKNSKFCPKCGNDISGSGKGKASGKMIVSIVVIVVAIAVIGLFATGMISFSDSNDLAAGENNTSSVDNSASVENVDSNVETSAKVVSSAKSDKFHSPDCEWAKKISGSNKITYPNRQAAIDAGKIPCQVCNP
ncbi:MAG: zinc ribbon domain-containing protein [Methanobrevibacter sp.]|uniref:zinc ribbon domain-containing protein n=1 Tax=Methanobrevibacter sp. TaxID=66852 RepID=UPI0026E03452|nr:zinc ribbon domain-containing protein [Methanobrevibacter sp.]MDO5848524.1 zinc ribbon domain-containing protein [Methanobrevibacter sp.]